MGDLPVTFLLSCLCMVARAGELAPLGIAVNNAGIGGAAATVGDYPLDAWEGDNFGKVAFGWQAFAGFMFPIANRLTIDLGFKYSAAKGKFADAFVGFDNLDLSGYHIIFGLNYWF